MAPQQRAVSTAARPLMDDGGRLTGAVVVYSDVTGLVEALAANEELVSNVSHEFRSPLNSILGNVDLVLEDSRRHVPALRPAARGGAAQLRDGSLPWCRT